MSFDHTLIAGEAAKRGLPACEEVYYPEWSSRGMRPVVCGRPAKWRAENKYGEVLLLCGTHRNSHRRWHPNRYIWTALP